MNVIFSVSQTKNTTSDAYIAYYASIAHSFYTVFIVLAVLEQKGYYAGLFILYGYLNLWASEQKPWVEYMDGYPIDCYD